MIRIFVVLLVLLGVACDGFAQAEARPAETASQRRQRLLGFYRELTVEAYERVGRRGPDWDADVRSLLEALARQLALSYCPSGDEYEIMATAGKRAQDAGCTDPLVLFALARSYQHFNRNPDDIMRLYVESAKRTGESAYHPLLKCMVSLIAAEHRARDRSDPRASRREGRRLVEVAMRGLPLALNDPNVPATAILETFDLIGDASRIVERDRAIVWNEAFPQLQEAMKDRPGIALTARQRFMLAYALDTRRDTSATPQQNEATKLERLAEAAAAGEQAWQLDPRNVRAAELMIHIESARGATRDVIDQWFARAVEADPGRYNPWATRMSVINLSDDEQVREMVEFGRRCAATEDWESGIPMLLIEAHLRAASQLDGRRLDEPRLDYFRSDPAVWSDISRVYEPYLRQYPDSRYHRSRYAQLAAWCGQWQTAQTLLDSMGDQFGLSWFRNRDAWMRFRAEVAGQVGAAQ